MGCACTKNLKTEAEVDFEQKNENNEGNLINNTSNFYEMENNNEQNNDNLKNKGQKSKTLINSTTKDDNLNNPNLEKENTNNAPYKQIDSDKITKEELNDLLSKYEPFNDNIIVEIQPTTLCEKKRCITVNGIRKIISVTEGGYKYGLTILNILANGKKIRLLV
jgi:hypothetical protein